VARSRKYVDFDRQTRLLAGLLDGELKLAAVAGFFDEQGEDVFEEFVHHLIQEGRRGIKRDQSDLLTILAEFAVKLPPEAKERMAASAWEKRHMEAAGFFSSPRLSVPETGRDEKVLKGRNGKPLTLGERKNFARNPSRHILAKLLHDPSPEVIRNLLGSPRMTEKDVIRIASMRPTRPEILEVIFRSRRWISSYRVKVTLVSNPYLPPEIGVKIVPSLLMQDLRSLVEDTLVHPEVRAAMKLLLSMESPEFEGDVLVDPGPDDA
jgi:hypothetical protein